MPDPRIRWAERQLRALIDAGWGLADAEIIVALALKYAPEQDLDGPIDPERVLHVSGEVTAADVADARAAWYASDAVPAKWKRLLDATEVAGE